jgi:hypothetical protein
MASGAQQVVKTMRGALPKDAVKPGY